MKPFIWYKLAEDGKTPVGTTDHAEAEKAFTDPRSIVGHDIIDGVLVSTRFIVLNHSFFSDTGPTLWETMIFKNDNKYLDPDLDQWQRRYSSYDEALKYHKEAVEIVKEDLKKNSPPPPEPFSDHLPKKRRLIK